METLLSLTESSFDVQLDNHLEAGDVIYSEGPDRAYLYLPYRHPDGIGGNELLAIWRVNSVPAAELLATGLGAPMPQACRIKPFEVTWIRGGQIAVKRKAIGADAAMWLLRVLAAQNLLDYQAHLFGGHDVDET